MHQAPPTMTQSLTARSLAKKRLAVIILGGIAGIAVGLAGVYGIGRLARNVGSDPACQSAVDTARRLAPLARGEVANLTVPASPHRLPEITFQDSAGQNKTLADWRGRTVLLNLWATWCVPCRKEMPALEALQEKLGGPGFEVVAINIDTRDPDKPKAWLKDVGVTRLAYYADPNAKVFQDLKVAGKALGMPTTILLDGAGCELGNMGGPAEWASEDALKLIGAAMQK
jgi:thiol-disulfide isomerase/thioredoxin